MTWLAVAIGGAIGAMARYGLLLSLSHRPDRFPVATFLANLCGCFLMGVLYVLIVQRGLIPTCWRPFLTVGFLGAFTTFSTFSLEALLLWQNQQPLIAVLYVTTSVVGCLLAVWLGYTAMHFYFSQ